MGSVTRYSKLSNPKNPSTSSDTEGLNPNASVVSLVKRSDPSKTPLSIEGSDEDSLLARSEFLSREEVIRRRSRRVKQLARYYREQYWALMEEVRVKYREYYWEYGKSPFRDDQDEGREVEKEENGGKDRLRLGFDSNSNNELKSNVNTKRCAFPGCKSKAMALTSYCHPHILSDTRQKLYKPCSAPVGQITCGKPILTAVMPSLCNSHLQKYQKNVSRALKKGGLNIASSKAPKFSVIIAEYVNQIQAKRREARDVVLLNDAIMKECGS